MKVSFRKFKEQVHEGVFEKVSGTAKMQMLWKNQAMITLTISS